VAIAVITRWGQVLICQRPPTGSFAGYWEFPGGKRKANETIAQCLLREVREELAIEVRPVRALRTIDHDYPGRSIRLHPYLCDHVEGKTQLLACQAARWVQPPELRHYQFPPANEQLIEEVIERLTQVASGTTADGSPGGR
jgi:mutator protein MutT